MAAKRRRRGKMREGECRLTKSGQKYCKEDGQVRFVAGGGRSRRGLSGSRRSKSGTRGKTCKRFKRVPMKGTTGKVRRCAKFG